MSNHYELQYLYLEQEVPIIKNKQDQSDEEKRVEVIQVFGEEE